MMKHTTRESYSKRIERVIAHIAKNLDYPLDLNRLAEKAHLSPFHFHRVYVALMGETVSSTVRRLRLHRAAAILLSSNAPLATIAKDTGYSNAQAFSRAFKEVYRVSPKIYRDRGGITDTIQFSKPDRSDRQVMYDVSIEYRDPLNVVSIRHVGDYKNIDHSVELLLARSTKYDLQQKNMSIFIVYYDDPTIKEQSALRADICMTAPADFELTESDDLNFMQTPGGRCAVMKHTGPFSELIHAYDWLFGEWLSDNEEEPDDQPHFQQHNDDPRIVSPADLQTWVYLPLKEKVNLS